MLSCGGSHCSILLLTQFQLINLLFKLLMLLLVKYLNINPPHINYIEQIYKQDFEQNIGNT